MHVNEIVAKLKPKRHVVGEEPVTRFGVRWLTVDGVSMTERQAMTIANGGKTVDEIDRYNRKRAAGSPVKRSIAGRR